MQRSDFDASALPDRKDLDGNEAFIRACFRLLGNDLKPSDPETLKDMRTLQHRLYHAGRHDVALGRLFEGHVDAMQILHRYASPSQHQTLKDLQGQYSLLGVWNAEGPDHHLRFENGRLTGGKSYASGAGVLTHALVTSKAGTPDVQLHLIDLERSPPEIDRSWWSVAGMQQSQTHQVRWTGAKVMQIGGPGDYEREPWFSGGALRFATVQAGGLAGLLDAVVAHLKGLGRADDAIQQRRLAELHMWASAATNSVLAAGEICIKNDDAFIALTVSNVRNIVYECCERGIAIAQRACGTTAYFETSQVCRFTQDLGMYIRQPGPDAQMAKVGKAVGEGTMDPWPCGL